jgi:predicted acetyltransferase
MLRSITEDELAEAVRSASLAFAVRADEAQTWLEATGLENVCAWIVEGRPTAFMIRVAMGQYLLGKSLPMLGVAGVTVPPEHRGKGYARAMMREALSAMRAQGFVLSTLYPSTKALYRSVGYEQCGALYEHRVFRAELAGLRGPSASLITRSIAADDPAVRALYAAHAARSNGYLDRGEYVWRRVAQQQKVCYEGLGSVRPDGSLAAYAFVAQAREGDDVVLKVRDFAYDSEEGARAVLSLCDRFTTISDAAVFYGGPTLPLLSLLEGQKFDTRRVEYTMVRLVNVERALAERAYPAAVRATLAIEVTDDTLSDNEGRYVLRVDEGSATVTKSAAVDAETATLTIDVRALAPLFMGWSTATELVSIGAMKASSRAVALANAVFSGPPPALSDYF